MVRPSRLDRVTSTRLGDGDGNGTVQYADLVLFQDQLGEDYTVWPSYEPGMILVSTAADELDADYSMGDLSLREALGLAASVGQPGHDTIVFLPTIDEIALSLGELSVSGNVTIAGPGADQLTISGNGSSRVFNVTGSATATIRDLRITDGWSQNGGAIANAGVLTIERSQIDGSSANAVGGGIYTSGGTVTLRDSTIADNHTNYVGGGIFFGSGSLLATNSTISGNAAAQGGGIFAAGAGVQLVNCTVTANRANVGSGIYSNTGTALHNSIVAGNLNSAGYPTTSDIGGYFASGSSYNLIGYDSNLGNGINNGVNHNMVGGQSGAPAIDPRLSALGYYGGPTMTHVLLSDSVAIDAGDNAVALSFGIDEDQRGEDRVVDWDGVGGDQIDIGAVELAVGEVYS